MRRKYLKHSTHTSGADHRNDRPSVKGDSTDSEDDAPTGGSDEDIRTIYGDSSDKFNAKIIGYTKEGDVILRISPELTQELVRPKTSSIKWDDAPYSTPNLPVPRIDIEKTGSERRKVEFASIPRTGTSRHRSSSSVTFKGKEKELSLDEQRELA